MANSYTPAFEGVCGNFRVSMGTLAMTDGAAGTAAGTGMDEVMQVVGTSSQMARLTHSASTIAACTALSGASYQVIIFGR